MTKIPKTHESIAISILEQVLDYKMEEKHKNIIRNFMIPAMEYIESSESPEDLMKKMYFLVALFSVPSAIAVDGSIQPHARKQIIGSLAQKYFVEMEQMITLLDESSKKVQHAQRSQHGQHEQDA